MPASACGTIAGHHCSRRIRKVLLPKFSSWRVVRVTWNITQNHILVNKSDTNVRDQIGYTSTMTKTSEYTVELTNFAGPLDLLLSLIEKRELEITEVAVGQVTGDYLRTMSAIEHIDERELMWFLDIATRLLSYKSRALRLMSHAAQANDDDADDTTSLAELTEQLRQLQIIRRQAKMLSELYGPTLQGHGDGALLSGLPPANVTAQSLADSWQTIMSRRNEKPELPRHEVQIDRLDIAAATKRLLSLLKGQIRANHLLGEVGTPRERVERLLALLEMIKQNLVELMSEGEEHYVKTV